MKTLFFTTNDIKSREGIRDYIDYLNDYHKGKNIDYLVTFKKNKPVRSHDANAYYWVCLQAIAAHTGDRKEDLHEEYQLEYNFTTTKRGIKVPKGTSGLDTSEFAIYVNKVKTHAKEFHRIYIADPRDRFYNVWEQQTRERYDAMFISI